MRAATDRALPLSRPAVIEVRSRARKISLARARGFALLLVLWTLALLTIMAGTYALNTREERALSVNLQARAEAQAIARAAIHHGIWLLLHPDLEHPVSQAGDAIAWTFADGTADIFIVAESGKIDINTAPLALLEGLARHAGAGEPAAVAASILDWRDTNRTALANGAEDADYAAAGRTYGAADAPFVGLDEIRRVLGVTADVAAVFDRAATVHSRNAKLNVHTAPRDALMALPGATPEVVDAFIDARRNRRPGEALPTHVFANAQAMMTVVAPKARPTGLFSIGARAASSSGARVSVTALVLIGQSRRQPYEIIGWRHNHEVTRSPDQSRANEQADSDETDP